VQIIPVFDLKEGLLVHAVGGMREDYRPLRTQLLPGPEPEKACATLVGLGFRRFYIADLDAITRQGSNFGLVRRLIEEYPIEVWLDAGLTGAEKIPLPTASRISWVAGSETLARLDLLSEIRRQTGPGGLVFSLDTRNGDVLAADPALKGIEPAAVIAAVSARGVADIIVLDLRAVGSGAGLNWELLDKLARRVPGARLFPGGGLTGKDVTELKKRKIPGVLTATALYSGQIAAAPEL
jgi:phosphoribosylformimino-5-aminoimidazole carboxamide ribotide isomerase